MQILDWQEGSDSLGNPGDWRFFDTCCCNQHLDGKEGGELGTNSYSFHQKVIRVTSVPISLAKVNHTSISKPKGASFLLHEKRKVRHTLH